DLSPISIHSTATSDYTFLSPNKYNAVCILKVSNYQLAIKTPYLRESFRKTGTKVTDIIGNTLPNTFILAFFSIAIAIGIGVVLGIVSALYKNSLADKLIALLSSMGMSIPSFFSAILFAWLFGFVLQQYTNLNMTGS